MNKAEIKIHGLSKSFGKIQALNELKIDFEPGLMHGVIGPEGAGKTTLMRLMAGLLTPSVGKVAYFSEEKEVSFEAIRPSIAYMPERQSLYADLSISEHLDFFAKLYHLSAEDYKTKRERLLSITRLDRFVERPAGKLSGGMYKKLGLICALLRSPQILLLDEPTNGVDPISRREFWELLYELKKESILIVVTTAYMDEAERCSRAHLLQEGNLVASGAPFDLLKEYKVKDFNELFVKKQNESEGKSYA